VEKTMSERSFITWTLDYTKDWVIETFCQIPEERLAIRPCSNINSAAWVFGHIAVTERKHVGLALEGIDDIPIKYCIFNSGTQPTDEAVSGAYKSRKELIDYWDYVREKTRQYLDKINDEDLYAVSPFEFGGPNRNNPRREWFIMTIQHQNYHWGQLSLIKKFISNI
jgi:uncharacterized damage-inducible protein DinB